jgi:hypothetical protein
VLLSARYLRTSAGVALRGAFAPFEFGVAMLQL